MNRDFKAKGLLKTFKIRYAEFMSQAVDEQEMKENFFIKILYVDLICIYECIRIEILQHLYTIFGELFGL